MQCKLPVLSRIPRMVDWAIIALVLSVLVWLVAPQQLPVSLYKLSLVTMAAVAGYWIDRSLFPYARPDDLLILGTADRAVEETGPDGAALSYQATTDAPMLRLMGLAMIRRAVIVAAAMIAVSLGA